MTWRQPTRIGGARGPYGGVPSELAVQPAAAARGRCRDRECASRVDPETRPSTLVSRWPRRRSRRDRLIPDRGRDRRSGRRRARGARSGRAGARVRVGRAARAGQGDARRGYPPARGVPRRLTNDDGMTHEAVVSLDERRVVELRDVRRRASRDPHRRVRHAGNAIVADPRSARRSARRGIRTRHGDGRPWSIGCLRTATAGWRRPGVAAIDVEGDNAYSRPIGGLVGVVDLNTMEVGGSTTSASSVRRGEGRRATGPARSPRRASTCGRTRITQPERAELHASTAHSSRGRGGRSTSGSPREGLCSTDRRRGRPVLLPRVDRRARDPYGDPNSTVHFRPRSTSASRPRPLVNALELGCDCLGEIRYLDACTDRGGATGSERVSACTRRTSGSCGSTSTTAGRTEWRCAAAGRRRASRRSATTSTASTGTSARTARSASRPS